MRSAAVLACAAGLVVSTAAVAAGPHTVSAANSLSNSIVVNGSGSPASWVVPIFPGVSTSLRPPALVSTSDNTFVLVQTGPSNFNTLRYAVGTSGSWSPWIDFGPGVTSRERPALASDSTRAHLVFHGQDFLHYYNRFLGTSWQGIEAVGGPSAQSFGPTAPSVAALGENAYVIYHDGGNGNRVSMRIRQWAGEGNPPVWSPTIQVSDVVPALNSPPAVTATLFPQPSGPTNPEPWNLMVAFVRAGDTQIMFSRQLNAPVGFEAARPIPAAFSITQPALIGLANGRALIVFKGNDNTLYSATWGDVGLNAWSSVNPVPDTANILGGPALAKGYAGNNQEAQLAFVNSVGQLTYGRWSAGGWIDRQVNLASSGSNFVLPAIARAGTVADPAVSASAPSSAAQGTTFTVTLGVTNAGPEPSSQNTLIINVPTGFGYEGIVLPTNPPVPTPLWTITSAPPVGSAGSLVLSSNTQQGRGAPAQVFTLTLSVAPTAVGELNISYNMLSQLPDPNLANQTGQLPITVTPGACYANCDGSTAAPVLNALDFSCFLQRYQAGDAYANCDGSTAAPVLNALDFSCYLQRFQQGCP